MGRNRNKPGSRKPKTTKPKAESIEEYMKRQGITEVDRVNYGVVTNYHGSGGKCTVRLILSTGTQIVPNIRLKGSYTTRKVSQKLYKGAIVLVDDGTIVLVYDETQYSVIDSRSLFELTKEIGDSSSESSDESSNESESLDIDDI